VSSHRHVSRLKAHWVVLGLVLVVVATSLVLVGAMQQNVGGSGTAAEAPVSALPPDTGSVIDASGDGIRGAAMPPRTVALTFDDGPDPEWTPQILDVLRDHGAKGTFFVIGSRAASHPELVRRMVDEGHEVGLHTFTHPDLSYVAPWRFDMEMRLSQNALSGAAGIRAGLARPPYSSVPSAVTETQLPVLERLGSHGNLVVLSDLDPRDWTDASAQEIASAAVPPAGEGAVVLLHDGGGDRSQTLAALPLLIDELRDRGYRLTTTSGGLGLPVAHEPASVAGGLAGTSLLWSMAFANLVVGPTFALLGLFVALTLGRALVFLVLARVHVRRRSHRVPGAPVREPVTVVVPAYNEAAGIEAAVRSIVASDHPDVEVLVVDDGSTDETAAIVERLSLPGVRLIRQRNAGKAVALSTGIRNAAHDLVVLVDGDTILRSDTVRRIVQPFADPRVGGVSGNAKVANRKGLLGRWQHLEYVIGFNLDRRAFDVLECIPTIPGAAGAFRKRALLDVGMVSDETLAEDTDLTMSMLRAGWKIVYEESALAFTEAPQSLSQLWRQRYRWCYGTLQSMWKHRSTVTARGEAGRLGRRGLPYLLVYQVLMPLLGPVIDLIALFGLLFVDPVVVGGAWLAFLGVQTLLAGYALRLDGESLRPLWALPLQQVVYRQLIYLVVYHSVITALAGSRLGWHRMRRHGSTAALLREVERV
jgi:peptidoglycan/xylan/chitin deacetylase (PgdA/CDA1 family)/GT2 family glycosyltransferase